jgi:hypothetical protein
VSGLVMVLVVEDDRRSDSSRWVCSDASREAKEAKKHVIQSRWVFLDQKKEKSFMKNKEG